MKPFTLDSIRESRLRLMVLALLLLAFIFAVPPGGVPQATAHTTSDTVRLYNPLSDGDGDFADITGRWATTPGTEPASHRIVYSHWGYMNDFSVDIFGPWRTIVSPFGTKNSSGKSIRVTVISVRPGCASGRVEDGGYRVTLEARDASSGAVFARADLMHVNGPRVSPGQVIGPWTPIGTTGQFRYSSCYQVSNSNGQHVHLEVVQPHRYACYTPRPNGASLTELTTIGKVGVHYTSGQRASC